MLNSRILVCALLALASPLFLSPDVTAGTGDAATEDTAGLAPAVISVDSFSGAASSSYAFHTPPGRLGVEPKLQLVYSSSSTSPSIVGRGWDLPLPYIERSRRSGQPSFTWADRFAINWNGALMDLIVFCDPCAGLPSGVREFRTEIETFMRIRSYSIPPSLTYWEVEDGRGRKYQFGGNGGSGVWTQVGDFTWALNRIEDAHGNYLLVDWLIDFGTLYPKEIRYTGNSVNGDSPTNKVEFGYEGRTDITDSYVGVPVGGAKNELRLRLRRVKSWAGTQVASIYLLDYTTASTGYHPISLCGSCAPNTVTCPNGNPSSCTNTCDPNTGFCSSCVPYCDLCTGVNCGGNSITCPGGIVHSCNNSCDPTTGYCDQCTPQSCSGGGTCGSKGPYSPDGPPGQCGSPVPSQFDLSAATIRTRTPRPKGTPPPSEPPVISPPVSPFTSQDGPSLLRTITRWNESGTVKLPETTFSYETDVAKSWGPAIPDVPPYFLRRFCSDPVRFDDFGAAIAEVNGDGLPDLLRGRASSGGGATADEVYINNGGHWTLDTSYDLPVAFVKDINGRDLDSGVRVLDINGDGLDDLVRSVAVWQMVSQFQCGFIGNQATVWVNNGHGWTQAPSGDYAVPVAFAVDPDACMEDAGRDLGVRMGDVNGDGLVDLVSRRDYQTTVQTNAVYLNNRSGWVVKPGWNVPEPMMANEHGPFDPGTRLVDINADGLVDIIRAYTWNDVDVPRKVYLGRGTADASGNVWALTTDPDWELPSSMSYVKNSSNATYSFDLGVRFGDVNGDGRLDIVRAIDYEDDNGNPSYTKKLFLHRGGKGWGEDVGWGASIPYTFVRQVHNGPDYDEGTRLVDLDGNGSSDFVESFDSCGGPIVTARRMSNDAFSDILAGISNGIGGTTSLKYRSSATYDNRLFGSAVGTRSYLSSTLPVVYESTESDGQAGVGHTLTKTVSYKGAFYRYDRRQFRGFAYVRENSPGGSSYTETVFVQDPTFEVAPLAGAVERQVKRRTSDDAAFSLTVNSFSREDRSSTGEPYFDWQTRSDAYLFDWSTAAPLESLNPATALHHTAKAVVKTFSAYPDEFIVSSETQELGDTTTALDDLFTSEEFINDGSLWRIGLIKKQIATDAAGGGGNILASSWTYYDNLSLGSTGTKAQVTKTETWRGYGTAVPGESSNRIETFAYDQAPSYGHLIRKTDAEGHESFMDYGITDSTRTFLDRTRAVTTGGGVSQNHTTDYSYDLRFGSPRTVAKAGGATVSLRYDSFGRIQKFWTTLDSEGLPSACYQYDLVARPVMVARFQREVSGVGDACGSGGMLASATFLDGLGRKIQTKEETSEPGYTSVVTSAELFDGEGRVSEEKEPWFSTTSVLSYQAPASSAAATTFEFDPIGRPKVVTSPGIPPRITNYNYTGWTITRFDAQSRRTDSDVDALGREVQRRVYGDASQVYSTNTLSYDRRGRLHTVHDSASNTWQYDYNAVSEIIASIDPDAGNSSFEYKKDGTLWKLIDAAGRTFTFVHDELHRPLQVTRPDSSLVVSRYDSSTGGPAAVGQLTSQEDSASLVRKEYTYDAIGRPRGWKTRVDGVWYEVSATLDSLGRVSALTYPDNSAVQYQYGADGRPVGIPGYVSNVRYTAWGDLTSMVYANNVTVTNIYDSQTRWLNRRTAFSASLGQNVVDSTYGRSAAGFVTSVSDAIGTASQTFVLDHQYRLTSATGSYGQLTYSYDALGNMTLKEGVTFAVGGAGPHKPVSASDGSVFEYDAIGSLKKSWKAGIGRTYDYDLDGNLSHVVDTEANVESWHTYGPDGDRVKRVEAQAGGASTSTVLISDLYQEDSSGYKKFIYLNSLLIAEVRGASDKHFYIDDQVGSTSVVTSSAGAVEHRMEYKPYGEFSSGQAGNYSPDLAFAGSRRDPTTGLHDFGARVFDSRLGRFLTVDPLISDIADPNALNPYLYAMGNPVSLKDFGGLSVVDPDFPMSMGWWFNFDTYAGLGVTGGTSAAGIESADFGNTLAALQAFTSGMSQEMPMPSVSRPPMVERMTVVGEYPRDAGSDSVGGWSDAVMGASSIAGSLIKDTAIGGSKGVANTLIGIPNLINGVVDTALSPFTSFQFGQMPGFEPSTPGERSAMAGVFICSFFVGAGEGRLAGMSGESAETLVIGRKATLDTPGTLRPGEFRLQWEPTPTKKSEWKINSGLLRQVMRRLKPIRDANPGDIGGPFLNAERALLRHFGWRFDATTSMWYPPM